VKIYRLAKTNFINDLSGEGARLFGGRWNSRGDSLLYFSEHLSLCVLELLTRIDFEFLVDDYSFIEVEVPTSLISILKNPNRISKNWRSNPPISNTQSYGSTWIKTNKALGLAVPSAVLIHVNNILINPKHSQFSELIIIKTGKLDLDSRVFNERI
jgi:RES domain-containing protein